jgi:hypothetical protein
MSPQEELIRWKNNYKEIRRKFYRMKLVAGQWKTLYLIEKKESDFRRSLDPKEPNQRLGVKR